MDCSGDPKVNSLLESLWEKGQRFGFHSQTTHNFAPPDIIKRASLQLVTSWPDKSQSNTWKDFWTLSKIIYKVPWTRDKKTTNNLNSIILFKINLRAVVTTWLEHTMV